MEHSKRGATVLAGRVMISECLKDSSREHDRLDLIGQGACHPDSTTGRYVLNPRTGVVIMQEHTPPDCRQQDLHAMLPYKN